MDADRKHNPERFFEMIEKAGGSPKMYRDAIDLLSDEWKPHVEIGCRFDVLDDMAQAGLIERRIDAVIKHGVPAGSRHYFRTRTC